MVWSIPPDFTEEETEAHSGHLTAPRTLLNSENLGVDCDTHFPFTPVFFFSFYYMDVLHMFVNYLKSSLGQDRLQISRLRADLMGFHHLLPFPEIQGPWDW